MKKKCFVFVLLVMYASCTKVVYQVIDKTTNSLTKEFDNDADLIQYLLDNNTIAQLEEREYLIDKTIYIRKYFQQLKGKGNTLIKFSGTGVAIAFQRAANNNFPVKNQIRDLSIELLHDNSVGVEVQSSHSSFDNISVVLRGNNSIGYKIMGDKNGTGSYYNIFSKCSVQGAAHIGKKNQVGIEFSFEESMPNRCPNANMFYGGRIGQVSKGVVIRGVGNTFYSPILEGNTQRCFDFDHPISVVGCVQNTVYSPYIEGADGVNVAYFGKNSIGCQVVNPYITSIGVKGKVLKNDSGLKTNSVSGFKE